MLRVLLWFTAGSWSLTSAEKSAPPWLKLGRSSIDFIMQDKQGSPFQLSMTFVYYSLAHAPQTMELLWFSSWHWNHTWRPTVQTIHWKPKQSSSFPLEGDICILQLAICLSIAVGWHWDHATPCGPRNLLINPPVEALSSSRHDMTPQAALHITPQCGRVWPLLCYIHHPNTEALSLDCFAQHGHLRNIKMKKYHLK